MKRIVLSVLVFISIAALCYSQAENKIIYIKKTDVGFDIYSSSNDKLLLEFTNSNSDSTDLALLQYIYDKQNEIESEVRDNKLTIIKYQEKDGWRIADWIQLTLVLITGGALIFSIKYSIKTLKIQKTLAEKEILPRFDKLSKEWKDDSNYHLDNTSLKFIILKNYGGTAKSIKVEYVIADKYLKHFNINKTNCYIPQTIENNHTLHFTYECPVDIELFSFELKLSFQDEFGNNYSQSITAITDGNYYIEYPKKETINDTQK